MKRQRTTFQFLGFVALADCLFAVSAGLLLLNPVQLPPAGRMDLDPEVLASEVALRIEAIEQELTELRTAAQGVLEDHANLMERE